MCPSSRGRPSGSFATAPKSITHRRPSGSSWKLPGCGSACSRPTRAGDEKWKRESSRPTRSRSSGSPDRMIADSGVPVTHSETIAFGADATTRGTTTCSSPSYAAANARCASASSR